MQQNAEKLVTELEEVKDKCEELRGAKQDAVRELLTIQEQHRAELRILSNSQQDDIAARESLERRMADLRVEVSVAVTSPIIIISHVIFDSLFCSWNGCNRRTHLNGAKEKDWKLINWLLKEITKN